MSVREKQDELIDRLMEVLKYDTRESAVAVLAVWMGTDRLNDMVEFLEKHYGS